MNTDRIMMRVECAATRRGDLIQFPDDPIRFEVNDPLDGPLHRQVDDDARVYWTRHRDPFVGTGQWRDGFVFVLRAAHEVAFDLAAVVAATQTREARP